MDSDYALEMRGITKDFPGVRALANVGLSVRRGEVHGLLGENGAGKSTLMKILDGVYPAGSYLGEIRVLGQPVELHSPQDAKRKGIGFVPQEIAVIEPLTVAENIFVGHLNREGGTFVSLSRLCERAAKFLRQHNIDLPPRRKVSALSSSQRQLVMIARVLSAEPSILILDEPTSSLTLHETQNLFRIIRHFQQRGGTVILITHKLAEVFELADRVTVLRDGAVAGSFERGAFNPDEVIAAMVGRHITSLFPQRDCEIGLEEVLRVENLTVPHPHLKNKNVVEEVYFTVRRGEILGLAGLVGAGRSEVLNALYGRTPHRGRIWVEGREVSIRSPRTAKKCGLGFLTEDRKREGLLFNFAIRENITINHLPSVSRWIFLNKRAESRCASDSMQRLAIRAPSSATMVLQLSGGNQQKVLLSKALLAQPKVLLLDEPTRGIDVGAKHEIYHLMLDLARRGVALVFVSSELPELLAMSDRIIVLAKGKVTGQFAKAEASEVRVMRAATVASGGREGSKS